VAYRTHCIWTTSMLGIRWTARRHAAKLPARKPHNRTSRHECGRERSGCMGNRIKPQLLEVEIPFLVRRQVFRVVHLYISSLLTEAEVQFSQPHWFVRAGRGLRDPRRIFVTGISSSPVLRTYSAVQHHDLPYAATSGDKSTCRHSRLSNPSRNRERNFGWTDK